MSGVETNLKSTRPNYETKTETETLKIGLKTGFQTETGLETFIIDGHPIFDF